MNKYQEALEEIINEYQYAYKWYCQFEGISEKKAKELFENFSNKKIGLLKELLNKETPMLVDLNYYTYGGIQSNILYFYCPNCLHSKVKDKSKYCPNCGQKLDWGMDEKQK